MSGNCHFQLISIVWSFHGSLNTVLLNINITFNIRNNSVIHKGQAASLFMTLPYRDHIDGPKCAEILKIFVERTRKVQVLSPPVFSLFLF